MFLRLRRATFQGRVKLPKMSIKSAVLPSWIVQCLAEMQLDSSTLRTRQKCDKLILLSHLEATEHKLNKEEHFKILTMARQRQLWPTEATFSIRSYRKVQVQIRTALYPSKIYMAQIEALRSQRKSSQSSKVELAQTTWILDNIQEQEWLISCKASIQIRSMFYQLVLVNSSQLRLDLWVQHTKMWPTMPQITPKEVPLRPSSIHTSPWTLGRRLTSELRIHNQRAGQRDKWWMQHPTRATLVRQAIWQVDPTKRLMSVEWPWMAIIQASLRRTLFWMTARPSQPMPMPITTSLPPVEASIRHWTIMWLSIICLNTQLRILVNLRGPTQISRGEPFQILRPSCEQEWHSKRKICSMEAPLAPKADMLIRATQWSRSIQGLEAPISISQLWDLRKAQTKAC